ncbi:MAG: murein biosynthesis integral membrane protein MurJ [Thermodesulfovibrionales bacterium]|nr:murein biosynthesis integral membrane protein MurJ [Thermodesulfovibrionales bacterium]
MQTETKTRITSAAVMMSFATFISRILGYIKDMILASYFGATKTSDVFFVAFRIPNLLREIFAEGAMSSALIPVLTDCQVKDGKEQAKRLVRSVFATLLIVVGIICVVGIVISPIIVSVIAPGFAHDTEKFNTTVILTQIMFPFLLFISIASLIMGVLNTRGVFFIPALAPAVLNVVTIICVVTLTHKLTTPIMSVAIGVVIGGLTQFLFQLPSFYKAGYSLLLPFKDFVLFHNRLKNIALLLLPATAGMAVSQINIFISTIFASFLIEGSVTALYYSMRLIQFPIGIFGVSMGMATLPMLSKHFSEGNQAKALEDFNFSIRLLFFITIPCMIGLIALKEPIVNLLFQRGEFDYHATIMTSSALMYYAMGIWAIVGIRLCTSVFYASHDTATPVKIAAFGVLVNILFSYLLMAPMGHNGIALANSISAVSNFVLLFTTVKRRFGSIGLKVIVGSFMKTLFCALIMGMVAFFVASSEMWKETGNALYKSMYLFSVIFMSVAIYGVLNYIVKSDELIFLLKRFAKKNN